MIETKDSNRSLIIPKWHSIRKTCIEEFTYRSKENQIDSAKTLYELKNDFLEFHLAPNVMKAIDLLNASVVLNDIDIYKAISKYLIENGPVSSPLLSQIKKVLTNELSIDLPINEEIANIKKRLGNFPHDPLLWLELARLYTIKGQSRQAEKAIVTAFSLSPANRFIARSASRFYLHINEPDIATKLLRKSYALNSDPMILATLTNCSIIAKENIKFFSKPSLELPPNDIFQYSELLATAGMLEMYSGNDKQAKKYFRKGWVDPTENVIAHAYWINRNEYPRLQLDATLDFNRSAEASTWYNFFELDVDGALEMAIKWSLEEPYSTHPFTCGSSIASIAGKNQTAIDIAKRGLASNPTDLALKNNLAFALLKMNRIEEADVLLDSLPKNMFDLKIAVIEATRGYREMKCGNLTIGRNKYLYIIDMFKKYHYDRIAAEATLYHALAEKEMNTSKAIEYAGLAMRHSEVFMNYPSIKLLLSTLQQ